MKKTTKTQAQFATDGAALSTIPKENEAYCWQILQGGHWCGAYPEDRWSTLQSAIEAVAKHSLYPYRIVTAAANTRELSFGTTRFPEEK